MRTRTGDAAPLLEVEEDGRSEDGQCKHHRPSISTSSWTRTAGLAVGAVLLILALRAAHDEARSRDGGHQRAVVISNGQLSMHVLPVGAIIQRLYVPDRHGRLADISLGFDDADLGRYTDGTSPYFGAVVGRVANRIANASFTLGGQTHTLSRNEGSFPGTLHGGTRGWDKVTWRLVERSASHVKLAHSSRAGEENYPGTVEASVTYTLTAENELLVEMHATTDEATPINMAQHAYFNLAGHESGSVLEHELTLPGATHVLPVDSARIPTGELRAVAGTPFDFSVARAVGARIDEVDGPGWRAGYDHCFVLHNRGTKARAALAKSATLFSADATAHPAATYSHPASGRRMEISTTAPGLQVYTSNFLDGSIRGKGGATYHKYGGLCLETQGFPNAVNTPSFPNTVLTPDGVYRHRTIYRFSAVPAE